MVSKLDTRCNILSLEHFVLVVQHLASRVKLRKRKGSTTPNYTLCVCVCVCLSLSLSPRNLGDCPSQVLLAKGMIPLNVHVGADVFQCLVCDARLESNPKPAKCSSTSACCCDKAKKPKQSINKKYIYCIYIQYPVLFPLEGRLSHTQK